MGIIKEVREKMVGRIAFGDAPLAMLMEAVNEPGDYLEIGVLHGGSLVCAALAKKEARVEGKVIGIDPLDGYYGYGALDPLTSVPVHIDTVLENVHRFDVVDRVIVIPEKSHPFPSSLQSRVFSTVLIDGDHGHFMPTIDWLNVKDRTTHNILFDNDEAKFPCVVDVCALVTLYGGWHRRNSIGNLVWFRKDG